MKTMKFRLLALIITLAAVTAATTTNAQRRSTTDNTSRKVENTRSGNKSNIEKKSADRDNVNKSRAATRSVKNTEIKRNNNPAKQETQKRVTKREDSSRDVRSRSNSQNNSKNSAKTRNENRERVSNQPDRNSNKSATSREKTKRSPEFSDRNSGNNNNANINRERNSTRTNSDRYNLNTDDVRYRTSRDYKGSDKYWSSDFRNSSRNNRNSAKNFHYNKFNHWDHNWEGYRWNHNSWINYYSCYNPYSFRNNKYYYHHNHYGHVLRKFAYRPQIFVHNHIRYYSYDGYFFRYHRGIGYVLVDMPFGMAFDYLPNNYDRVYINGYLYFRIGNLFFEHTNYGFQLIYYPERYFAFNDGYHNEGFRFNDMDY